MKPLKNKIAAFLGLVLAIPTIIEGFSVLLGISTPDQIVLKWLVVYNVAVAVYSIYVIFEIWRGSMKGKKQGLLILTLHLSVLLLLVGIYFTTGQVAVKSILAMSMRSAVWTVINVLIKGVKYE